VRVSVQVLGSQLDHPITLELPQGSTVGQALDGLRAQAPGLDPNPLEDPSSYLVLVEGVEVGNLEGLDTPLKDGQKLVVIPVVHGG